MNRERWYPPWMYGVGLGAIGALAALNVYAFALGDRAPWLLGGIVIADVVVVCSGIVGVLRYAFLAEQRSAVAEAAIERSQARVAAIVESAMDAILMIDVSHRIVLFNRAAETVFRCRREDALGANVERFIPARFRDTHREQVERFARTGVTSRRMGDTPVLWGVRADGEEFPFEASISQVREPGGHYFTVILRDVTRRKQADDALLRHQAELQELSARVLEAREEEKTLIARELHDELGQLLTALKMDLAWMRERLPPPGTELGSKAAQMEALLDRTVTSVRRISADLRPLMLDDLGLQDAISWLVEDFGQRSAVACELALPADEALEGLPRSLANTLYRVLQESLTNIARHAQARHAWVVVRSSGGELQLEVEDDGRGIQDEDFRRARSLGLKGMRERVLYLGGTLTIGKAPRGGTRVLARLPVARGAAEEAP